VLTEAGEADTIGTANRDGGIKMGHYLRKVIPHGTLAIIRGIPGSQVDIDRVDGVTQQNAKAYFKVAEKKLGNPSGCPGPARAISALIAPAPRDPSRRLVFFVVGRGSRPTLKSCLRV